MAKTTKMVEVPVSVLKPYANNAKKHGRDQLKKLKASIQEFGFLTPCVIDSEYNLIAGHGRVMAAKELSFETVPCVFIEGLTETQRRAYILADNRLGELGEWDFDIVNEELEELNDLDFDITLTGFELPDMEEQPEVVEDEFTENVETRCKLGDIWQLGEHRLICGDSTDVAVIDRLMDGVKADMSFTSPPYGVELGYNSYVDTFENTKRLVTDAIPVICAFTNEYVVLNWGDIVSAKDINKTAQPSQFAWLPIYDELMRESGWFIWAERIWKKVHARCSGIWSASSNRPVSDWEYIFTWAHKTPAYNERNSGSHFGVIDSAETAQTDTLSKHPGAFPVYVAGKVIEIHTKHNQSVLDVFGGSGSTLIACEQLNRKCYMCELDPHYCDVIINRWETFTGREAVLING